MTSFHRRKRGHRKWPVVLVWIVLYHCFQNFSEGSKKWTHYLQLPKAQDHCPCCGGHYHCDHYSCCACCGAEEKQRRKRKRWRKDWIFHPTTSHRRYAFTSQLAQHNHCYVKLSIRFASLATLLRSIIVRFFLPSFVCSLAPRSFVRSSVHSLTRSLIRMFVRSFFHSLSCLLIR